MKQSKGLCVYRVNGLELLMGKILSTFQRVAGLAYWLKVVSAKYLEKELKDLDEISYIKWY